MTAAPRAADNTAVERDVRDCMGWVLLMNDVRIKGLPS
jgi:hypothetical protein